MTNFSRRSFLKQLGAFAGLAVAGRNVFSASPTKPFNFLVAGDSLIWGQGLPEKQKFYHLTKEWLETEFFKNEREVKLLIKAHSGANINLRPDESGALRNARIKEDEFSPREVNVSFPSIRAQIEAARKEYEDPRTVDLIMLSGGITDIRLSVILNPLKSNDELKRDIVTHCNEKMFELLDEAANAFPNALIVVAGYYPFISKYTPASKIFNNLLEIYDIPQPLKFLINNPLNRRLLRHYRRKMVERSIIWWRDSTVEFQKAVERLNKKAGKHRAVFVESPLTEQNSIGAKKPMLYEIGKNGKAQDALAAERKSICAPTIKELKKRTKLKLRARTCEIATVGHPNPEASAAYAEAVKEKLAAIL